MTTADFLLVALLVLMITLQVVTLLWLSNLSNQFAGFFITWLQSKGKDHPPED